MKVRRSYITTHSSSKNYVSNRFSSHQLNHTSLRNNSVFKSKFTNRRNLSTATSQEVKNQEAINKEISSLQWKLDRERQRDLADAQRYANWKSNFLEDLEQGPNFEFPFHSTLQWRITGKDRFSLNLFMGEKAMVEVTPHSPYVQIRLSDNSTIEVEHENKSGSDFSVIDALKKAESYLKLNYPEVVSHVSRKGDVPASKRQMMKLNRVFKKAKQWEYSQRAADLLISLEGLRVKEIDPEATNATEFCWAKQIVYPPFAADQKIVKHVLPVVLPLFKYITIESRGNNTYQAEVCRTNINGHTTKRELTKTTSLEDAVKQAEAFVRVYHSGLLRQLVRPDVKAKDHVLTFLKARPEKSINTEFGKITAEGLTTPDLELPPVKEVEEEDEDYDELMEMLVSAQKRETEGDEEEGADEDIHKAEEEELPTLDTFDEDEDLEEEDLEELNALATEAAEPSTPITTL